MYNTGEIPRSDPDRLINYGEFATIKSQTGLNSYKISVKEWVAKINAIGLQAKAGRSGGTYAHSDIPFEFGMLISAEFKIYLDKILAKGRFGEIREDIFMPREAHVDESLWLASVEKTHAGAEGGHADALSIMDTKLAGADPMSGGPVNHH